MAGTRLLIHSWCLFQLVALLAISAYFGLCRNQDDRICRPLLIQQGRRWLGSSEADTMLRNATNGLSGLLDSSVLSVTIAVDERDSAAWQNFAGCTDQGDASSCTTPQLTSLMKVRSESSDHVLSVCENSRTGAPSAHTHSADVWVCEGDKKYTVVIVNATVVIYIPSQYTQKDRFDFVRSLMPSPSGDDDRTAGKIPERQSLDVTLWFDEETADWKIWLESLMETIRRSGVDRWPFLTPFNQRPPNVNVALSNSAIVVGSSGVDGYDSGAQEKQLVDVTTYLHELGVQSTSRPNDARDGSSFSANIIVPGPSTSRLWFTSADGEASGTSLLVQLSKHEWVVRVDASTSAKIDPRSSLDIAWTRLIDQVARQCLNIPSSLPSNIETTDGSIPSLYTKLWYHRALRDHRDLLLDLALTERRWIQNLPWSISVSYDTVSAWTSALELITNAWTVSLQEEALARFELARSQLLSLGSQPELMEPVDDFPLDQHAAVLAPLVMPLLLPLLLGLVREVRRYRELRDKTKHAVRDAEAKT